MVELMRKNQIPNSFCEVIECALLGLRRTDYISAETREKIGNILQDEVKWD